MIPLQNVSVNKMETLLDANITKRLSSKMSKVTKFIMSQDAYWHIYVPHRGT
jgi:hypothetical protein